ncbi:MAG TPA: HAMP domain-containing sensor histidine kinase [Beijerinckiaceae bacterium]|nr:HAMP domain-containing sensor histidine kinase [Beijerinckiaceae bacterium]
MNVHPPHLPHLHAAGRRLSGIFGLSSRLLMLTILFVMVAEVLIYVPSVANFRRNWLQDRVAAAQIAALALDAAPEDKITEELETRLLDGVGAQAIAVGGGGMRRLLAKEYDVPPEVDRVIDLRSATWRDLIRGAFVTLFFPAERPIRVIGPAMGADFVEVVLTEKPLRAAMVAFSRNILMLSLVISAITAGLVYLSLHWLIVRPVRRLSGNIAAFTTDPENASRVLAPSERGDEIGLAEQAVARMEGVLSSELRQKRRLADLGLAVSKINHELRNMLTTAQLLGDRIKDVDDPAVQRVAPRLVRTLGRAIDFCEATLAYGRASERLPQRRRMPLAPIVADLEDLTGLAPGAGIAFTADVPETLEIDADPEQLARILANLVRNAVQALSQAGTGDGPPRVGLSARRDGGRVVIEVSDNGPGVPERARGNLFTAFQASARSGGTGLGLPVTAELVRLHGGTITLADTAAGAHFRIVIPDRA